jgi:ferritin-like metal-binding protein YciE
MEDKVEELLLEQLKDAYSAERQALRCMQQSGRIAGSPLLKAAIEIHIEETKDQIGRLDEIFQAMSAKPGRKLCLAMKGLVEEAAAEAREHEKGPILDLVITASMQRIEHYEISAYGTMVMTAEALELQPVVKVLQQTLAEEQQTETKLTQMAKEELMTSALEDEGEEQRPASKPASPKTAPGKGPVAKPAATKSSAEPASKKPAAPKSGSRTASSRAPASRGR